MGEPVTRSRPTVLIGAASGIGASDERCGEGPAAIMERLAAHDLPLSWLATLYPRRQGRSRHELVGELCQRIALEVELALAAGDFPIVIGGDHSCAAGTWRGVARAVRPLGLLWIDAHMDCHTPTTSHSGNPHGMPLASLLLSADALLEPGIVCLVGVRSYEPEEADLLQRLGVKVFTASEVLARGLDPVLDDAIAVVSAGTSAYGITLDLDVIDPHEAPGVGTPEHGGLDAPGLLRSLGRYMHDRRLAAFEIAEFNPSRDVQGRTLRIVEELIATVLCGVGLAPKPVLVQNR